MGRFIREQCAREGVDVRGVRTDPQRLTSLVILGIRDDKTFPLIFYRDNCADSALDESDIDEAYIASAKAIVVTGTHFARANTAAAQNLAIDFARKHGRKVAFDIDYRPNLWGLAGHGAGEERYIKSDEVSANLQPILPRCDLIVGTEEEIMIAGGVDDPLRRALKAVRARSQATIVMKRGPMGCVVFPARSPPRSRTASRAAAFPSKSTTCSAPATPSCPGFLRGWLRDEPLETCCAFANAGGAFAVSRLLCSAEYPTWPELRRFLDHGSPHRALRHDEDAEPHPLGDDARARSRRGLMALAIDHRAQLEKIADDAGAPRERIGAFKRLAVEAAAKVAEGRPGFGMLLDGKYGREALFRAADHGFWIGRPVEEPGSRPLDFEFGGSLGAKLIEWPLGHTIKCLCFYHPDDPAGDEGAAGARIAAPHDAARTIGRELLIEIIASKHGPIDDDDDRARARRGSMRSASSRIGGSSRARPQPRPGTTSARSIEAGDPLLSRRHAARPRGARGANWRGAFAIARRCALVKGFAVGRTIFVEPAQAWFAGRIGDAEAVERWPARSPGCARCGAATAA